ncbi:MAG: methylenetetrahydrofolate reductase [Candidatus Omnitrophica bacterium]|nr:methylenetetrahydrofolate reductase [Candidatus Omnitrophota bacterium]MCM8793499.1 methylenetetrahydrofolate reductase [Candidatus Omnitrophota bacterium]
MNLREKVESGKFIVTSEIGPPKGIEIKGILEDIEPLRNKIDAFNVTDLQSSVMRLGSLAMCIILKQKGFEPIFQITCRDRNRLALQSDLLNAALFGIENVLALTGDHPRLGDHPQAKPVFDLDSVQLLEVIKNLNEGKDMVGNSLQGKPNFFPGAVVNPGAEPIEPEIIKMEKKIKAGAKFFQTQAVYDVEIFAKFIERVRYFKVPIFAGIVLLKSAGMARYMNENVAGVSVPQNIIEEMTKTKDKAATSVDIAARIITAVKPLCQGIHIMPIGWDKVVPLVLEKGGLI